MRELSGQSIMLFRRAAMFALLFVPLLSAAQAELPEAVRLRIEKQVRQYAEAPPDAEITLGAPKTSDFPGYWLLPVQIKARGESHSFQFLLAHDFSKLIYQKEFDLSRDPFRGAAGGIQTAGRPFRGNANAQVVLVVYDDFQCPFCARQYIALMNEVMNHYRDRVKVVMKDFPLSGAHPWAMSAAIAADCLLAQDQAAYWKFSDYVYTHQQAMSAAWTRSQRAMEDQAARDAPDADKLHACVAARAPAAEIERSLEEGHSLGVSATPATFINGEFFEGVLSPEEVRAALDRALRESGAREN